MNLSIKRNQGIMMHIRQSIMIKCTVENKQTCCVIRLDSLQINYFSNFMIFFHFLAKFNSKNYSFVSFLTEFNSNIYSIFSFSTKFNSNIYSFFSSRQNSIPNLIHLSIFRENSIQRCIQNFEIGCIQFNKIFI